MINLSPRLAKIADFIEDKNLLDIGSDHCYLPCFLVTSKGFKSKIYASENKEGPYLKMVETCKEEGLEDRIILLKGDGLDVYKEDIKEVVITGMGGKTIANILLEGREHLIGVDKLVLEPQSDYLYLRKTLLELGFKCIEEIYIKERSKFYPVMVLIKGEDELSKVELTYGKVALINNDEVLKEYLLKKKDELEKVFNKIASSRVKEDLELIDRGLDYYGIK